MASSNTESGLGFLFFLDGAAPENQEVLKV